VRVLAAVVVALSTIVASARSNAQLPTIPHYELPLPSVPSDKPSHNRNLDQTRANDRETESVPFVVKELPRERPQQEIQEAKEKAELDRELTEFTGDLASYTKLLVGVTLFLAVVTGGLVVVSFFQMRDARKSIRISERNVDISEKALVDLEAPFLYVRITNRGLTVTETKGGAGKPSSYAIAFGPGRLVFGNYGRTPARISAYFETTAITERQDDAGVMPEPIAIDAVEDYQIPEGVVILPNGGESKEYEFSALSYAFKPPLDPNMKSLFLMGFVRYRDIFGNRYRTGFCFVFDHRQNAFVLIGDDPYNYRCREETAKPEQSK
jgi:hypothetical protein